MGMRFRSLIILPLLVASLQAALATEVLHNVGGSTTVSIPSDWTISSNAPNFFCHTSSYSVILNVVSVPATDSQKKIYVSDYDALNTALAPSLYTLEFDYINQQVNVGGGKLHDMGTPTLNYGPTPNYDFYLGSSYNSYTISTQQYPSLLMDIITFHYVFFDGTTIYMARATVNENVATTAEKILLTDVISSVSSTAIQSPLEDSDGDGISNYDEVIFYSSDPTLKDTNSDGIDDDVITSLGGNPRWDISSTLEYIEENPSRFNLVSKAVYDTVSDERDARPTLEAYNTVVTQRDSRLTVDEIRDARVGSTMIEVSGGKADITMTLEETSDLTDWSIATTSEKTIEVDAPAGTRFYRFKMPEPEPNPEPEPEPEPDPLPAIATDTYGDKLVYDESNNLYVNDENTPLIKDGINLKTDTYSGWNFYAIESTDSGYICIIKNNTQIYQYTFDPVGNHISGSSVSNLSRYESLLGQSLN